MRHMVFRVEAVELTDGWKITIDHAEDAPTEVFSANARLAFGLAGVAMQAWTDPLERAMWLPSAPDGPPQGATE